MPDWMKTKTRRRNVEMHRDLLETGFRRAEAEPSRAECRAMLEQAVRNTAAMPQEET